NEMAEQLELRLTELEAERRRLRAATLRFGEVLVATHDSRHLRRAIVEAAVEAAGAAGGELLAPDGHVGVGDLSARADRIEQPLAGRDVFFGTLVLVGDSFCDEARELAALLARQGVVALENALLHEIV